MKVTFSSETDIDQVLSEVTTAFGIGMKKVIEKARNDAQDNQEIDIIVEVNISIKENNQQ